MKWRLLKERRPLDKSQDGTAHTGAFFFHDAAVSYRDITDFVIN